jgi:phosphate transport system permease protein
MASISQPQAVTASDVVRQRLSGRRIEVGGFIFEGLLLLALVVALAVLVTLLANVLIEGAPVLASRGLDFLTAPLASSAGRSGVGQGVFGSLVLTAFVVIAALPIGIGAAIYLEEYAHDTPFTRLINTTVRNLAGVPAIVYGLLGLAFFVTIAEPLGNNGRNIYAGGLTLAVLVLPIVIITSAEALRAVPWTIREAAFGVGATRWEVVRSHVLPYAAPGIFTGTILTLARAFGETAPLIVVGAIVGSFRYSADNLFDQLAGPFTALPTIIYAWSKRPEVEFRDNTAAAIIVLLVVLLAVNAIAIYLRNRFERRW